MKAPDMKFFLVPQGASRAPKAQASRGNWGHAPQEIFKTEHSETPFPAFLNFPRPGWSSLKFSLNKYWYQSTGRGMRNDRMICPASNENPDILICGVVVKVLILLFAFSVQSRLLLQSETL